MGHGTVFTAARVPDADKLNITTMYLTGDAKLWRRTQNADDVSVGHPRIDTWDKLIKEMRDQFLPSNASWLAREIEKAKADGFGEGIQ